MATFIELKNRVDVLVDDDYLKTLIGDFINQGVDEISGGFHSLLDGIADPIPNTLTPPLPELFTINTIMTSVTEPFVNMPENFQRDLQFVSASAGYEIDIEHSLIDFTETYPLLNRVGRISSVKEHGRRFYYQGIPKTSETLTIHYYRKPVKMVNDTDKPDGIPEHLHISLLVNFAAWKAYEFIEDDMEENTPNTDKYQRFFVSALRTLELSIPHYSRGLMTK